MMDTTTPADGAVQAAQPAQTTEAVGTSASYNADQVITNDENGTPSLTPVTSDDTTEEPAAEPAAQSDNSEQAADTAQADADSEVIAWAEKKGLKIDPKNPNEVQLARLNLQNDRRFHEAQQKSKVQPPEMLEETGDDKYDPLVQRQNELELKSYVRDWFDANPEMKDHRDQLQEIANERPWLSNLDDVKAHFLANPSREAQLKQEGGREALTNLAQKQQAIPPSAGATNSREYDSAAITPQNVAAMVDSHDQRWFEKNHQAISAAMEGRTL